jgi:osmotically-inducible protein OsmY
MRLALLPLAVTCTLLPVPVLAGPPRADHEVCAEVVRAFSLSANYTIFDDVAAAVRDGVVVLTGRVTLPAKARAIEKRVARVPGVRRVEARIGVLPVSPLDEDLRYRIARAIYGNPNFWGYAAMAAPPIHIVVERGHVTLTGTVTSEVDRMLARSLASSFGASSVRDELRTEREVRQLLDGID